MLSISLRYEASSLCRTYTSRISCLRCSVIDKGHLGQGYLCRHNGWEREQISGHPLRTTAVSLMRLICLVDCRLMLG